MDVALVLDVAFVVPLEIDELLHRTTVTHGDADDEQVVAALEALVRALALAGARLPLRRATEQPSYHRQAGRLAVGALLVGLALVGLATLIAGCAPTCVERCDAERVTCRAACPPSTSATCQIAPTPCATCYAECELHASGCLSGCGYAESPDLTRTINTDSGGTP